jgi:hypothetical protein
MLKETTKVDESYTGGDVIVQALKAAGVDVDMMAVGPFNVPFAGHALSQ